MWAGRGYEVEPGKDKNEKVKRDAATQLRPAEANGKNAFLPRNDRSYGLKRNVFQTEKAPGRVRHDATGRIGMMLLCGRAAHSPARRGRFLFLFFLK